MAKMDGGGEALIPRRTLMNLGLNATGRHYGNVDQPKNVHRRV